MTRVAFPRARARATVSTQSANPRASIVPRRDFTVSAAPPSLTMATSMPSDARRERRARARV
jgi:hypothetical protein